MKAWPHVRTALIGLHVLAVLVLALPNPGRMVRKEAWKSEKGQRDLRAWNERLWWLGYETTEQFESDLWKLATGYQRAHRELTRPFSLYVRFAGVRQGWAMFSSPDLDCVELHVDVETDGTWEPIYRPRSNERDFLALQLRHHRVRKLIERFARGFDRERYRGFTRVIASRVAEAFPDSHRIRIRLHRYSTLLPDEAREVHETDGRYAHRRTFQTEELR